MKPYERVLLDLNPKLLLAPSSSPRTIRMPACVRYRINAHVVVHSGDTLDKLLLREIGRTGDKQLRSCIPNEKSSRCDKTLADLVRVLNPGVGLDDLKPGTQLTLPVVTGWTTFEVRPELGQTALQVSQAITDLTAGASNIAATSPIVKNEPAAPDLQLIRPMSADDPKIVNDKACFNAPSKPWPFDPEKVLEIVRRNLTFMRDQGFSIQRVGVAIVDTGLVGFDTTYPKTLFIRNTGDQEGHQDLDGNGWQGDVYGVTVFKRNGEILPTPNYDVPLHGTQVADMALGGREFRNKYSELSNLIGLKIVNIVEPSSQGVSAIREGGLLSGLRYAADQRAGVANLSIAASAKLPNLLDTMRQHSDLLLVIAAGNETKRLGQESVYPASYGGEGELLSQAITVAAHDGTDKLAEFSNSGRQYVDLAAPGCALPFTDANGTATHLFGTSFAAPLVSFTASMLRAFGLNNPRQVKDRLYVTVDYKPRLAVKSEGTLNIVKALAVFDDLIETSDGISLGSWLHDNTIQICFDRDEFRSDRIAKISAASILEATGLRVVYKDTEGRLQVETCSAAEGGITFSRLDGQPVVIPWERIIDFVPRTLH